MTSFDLKWEKNVVRSAYNIVFLLIWPANNKVWPPLLYKISSGLTFLFREIFSNETLCCWCCCVNNVKIWLDLSQDKMKKGCKQKIDWFRSKKLDIKSQFYQPISAKEKWLWWPLACKINVVIQFYQYYQGSQARGPPRVFVILQIQNVLTTSLKNCDLAVAAVSWVWNALVQFYQHSFIKLLQTQIL